MVCMYRATMVTMSVMDHSDSPIIDRLGGNSALAKMFSISSQAVSKWRKEGIPEARRMYLKLAHPSAFDELESSQRKEAA